MPGFHGGSEYSVTLEIEDVEDEAPLCYYHNWTIYPCDIARHGEEPIMIMWSKASPLEEGLHIANHIVPVVRKYPVVCLLFKGELEDGAPTSEHVFLYENLAEEETPEVMKGIDSEKGSDNTVSDSSHISNGTSTSVNDTEKKQERKLQIEDPPVHQKRHKAKRLQTLILKL